MFEQFPFCLWCLSIPQVPSAFFVADCFLQLHRYYLNGKLFRPDRAQRETVLALAGDEGSKAKRCIGALRYLWRNAKGSSHDRHVQELKDFLISSPIQEANARARAEESEAENEDAGEPAPADDPQDEALSSSSEVEQADNDMEIDNGGSQGDSVDASSLYAQTLLLGGKVFLLKAMVVTMLWLRMRMRSLCVPKSDPRVGWVASIPSGRQHMASRSPISKPWTTSPPRTPTFSFARQK